MQQMKLNEPLKYKKPSLGICLSGGGARGLAHIGVLRALESCGINVNVFSGASMGGVIAMGYAAGLNSYEIEKIAIDKTRSWQLLHLADPGLPNGGLIRGEHILAFFEEVFGEATFSDLPNKAAVVAVDLNSHKEVVLDEGSVSLALRATTSIPGVFMPVEYNNMRLVDGGVLNNLPVDVTYQLGAQKVIAVDISLNHDGGAGQWIAQRKWIPGGITSIVTTLNDSFYAQRTAAQETMLKNFPPNILITPQLPDNVNTFLGYQRVTELVAAGEEATKKLLPQILEFMEAVKE